MLFLWFRVINIHDEGKLDPIVVQDMLEKKEIA